MSQTEYDYESLKKTLESVLESLSHLRAKEESLDLTMSSKCTSGAYGDVFQATLKRPGLPPQIVAVKELRTIGSDLDRVRVAIRLAREIRIWSQLSHPNVLEFVGYHLNQRMSTAWLISPYAANGNLFQFIQKIPLDSPLRIELVADTARGLAYLHAQGICHGDMKPANILVTEERTAVIADFGLSRLADNTESGLTTTKTIKGSLRYWAPELLEEGARHTLQSDAWAFGCVMMEVLTGILPYPNAGNDLSLALAMARRERPSQTKSLIVAEPIGQLLQECWQLEPQDRPTMPHCATVTNRATRLRISGAADESMLTDEAIMQEPSQQASAADMLANVLPPITTRHGHHHRLPEPAIVQPRGSSPPPPPVAQVRRAGAQPPNQPPNEPPVLPPQTRPAPVPDVKERVTVNGIPSQTVVDGKLVIGHDRSTSVRSYTPLKRVGDGSFGTVVLADWHSPLPPGVSISPMQLNNKFKSTSPSAPLRMVAIKRMKKKWQGGWAECSTLKELESLRRIPPHPNIIPLYDSFLLPETKALYFIFECMEGNLYQLIKSRKGRPLAGGLVAGIYRQVVEGLRHIHDSGYFHRDMKPENLLVTTTGLAEYSPTSPQIAQPHSAPPEKDVMVIVKLADFGLAREVNSLPPYTEYVSNRWYRAPEVLLRSTDYNKSVDMWALGTILAELVNLKPIFPGHTEVDQVQKIVDILGNPTMHGEYGVDERGRVRGGGDWARGVHMAGTVGYTFKKMQPISFHRLFDRNIPPSLIDCIADLIRYDPDRRLTAQQCKDHPYWKETENTHRRTIAIQPQAPHDRRSSSRSHHQQQPRQPEQQRQTDPGAGESSRKM